MLQTAFERLVQDLKHTARSLGKSPGFALVAVLTLALGIGANTATFSVVHGVLIEELPYPDSERLVAVWERSQKGHPMQAAWANFADWRSQARSFSALAAYYSGPTTLLGADRPLVAEVAVVSQDFWTVLGPSPVAGRTTLPDEHRVGAEPVAVVSHAFWRNHLGGEADLSGRRLDLAGASFAVVGVMAPGFAFPAGADVWVALEPTEPSPYRTAHNHRVVGRLAPGVDAARAQQELQRITEVIVGDEVDEYLATGALVRPLQEEIGGPVRRPLLILLGAAGLVLLVACANLGSTFLARGTERRREMAVRRSLGASRGRLLRQLFTESLVVALLGAGAGLVLAAILLDALAALAPSALPRLDEVRLDGTVLAFTLAASVATALLFGLLPGLRVTRRAAAADLRTAGRGSGDRAQQRTWSLLVASEVALALVLLVGSGLLIRSFWRLLTVETGFTAEQVATVDLQVPTSRYPEAPDLAGYYQEMLAALEAVPGVERAGVTSALPLSGAGANGRIEVAGAPEPTADADYRVVSGGYFPALGIPLVRGRLFDDRDHAGAPHAALVNQAMAEAVWPGEDPVGKRLTGGGMDAFWDQDVWATVVGVVGNVRHRSLASPPRPEVYFHLQQRPGRARGATVVVKAEGPVAAVTGSLREALRRVDPEVPVEIGTVEEVIHRSVADRRFALLLLGAFAAVGLLLAAVGIYGVVAYAVARRRRELGIRLALGAAPAGVRNLVVRHSMAAVAAGVAAGSAGALALSRLLESLLYEVTPADPATFAVTVALLATAALLASYLPARRATRIDPMETLRAD